MRITKRKLKLLIAESLGDVHETEDDRWISCGGVVFDKDYKQVILCLPSGSRNWTLPKGRVDPGETHEQTAIREVEEETGWICEIIKDIPGTFEGSYSINKYFIMHAKTSEPTGNKDWEMEKVEWFSLKEAISILGQKRKNRDFNVLKSALKTITVTLNEI